MCRVQKRRFQLKNKSLYWTDKDYSNSIEKLKEIAASNLKLSGYDNTSPGNKSTECNHGLCDESIEENASGIYRQVHHKCPLDMRKPGQDSGCFYYCRYFQADRKEYKELPHPKTLIERFRIQ